MEIRGALLQSGFLRGNVAKTKPCLYQTRLLITVHDEVHDAILTLYYI